MPETKTPGALVLDYYEVLTRDDGSPFELGRGAMGITYKALDTNLRMAVALKVINSRFLNSDLARQRFVREARSAAKLRHRNVASVFHLGMTHDAYFYAMEFIDGETVESLIRRSGPQPPLTALRIALQVARALNAAQQHGLVHRDIKPANLMLVREDEELCVKVIDFGLVKVLESDREEDGDDDASPTVVGAGFFGTPHFASPEQLREEKIDVRSDIYSLGATLWYMLAGEAPFSGTLAQVLTQQLGAPPPFEKLAHLPPPVETLLSRMLAKPAEERPQTAAALRQEIEECIEKIAGGPGAAAARAAIEEAGASSVPVEPGTPASHPTFQPGTVVAGRSEILRPLRETNMGAEFQARDESKCDVRLVALHPQHVANRELFTRLEREVEILRTLEHENLLRVESLEVTDKDGLLLLEWTNGFALLEVLRARRELTAPEVIPLLEQIAAGIDYALAAEIKRLSLALHRILIHFPGGLDAGRNLRETPITAWPTFVVKLNPLDIIGEAGLSETWAGGQTMVGDESIAVSQAAANPRAAAVRALGTVGFELLGGQLGPLAAPGAAPRFVPLATLTESGNAVLKRALEAPESFKSAVEFASFLGDLQGLGKKGRVAAAGEPRAKSQEPSGDLPRSRGPKSIGSSAPPARPSASRAPAGAPAVAVPSASVAAEPPQKQKSPALLMASGAAALLAVGGYLIFHHPAPKPGTAGPTPVKTITTEPPPATPREISKATPAPAAPTQQELLKTAIEQAEAVEAKGYVADAIAAWVDVARKFPEAGKPKIYLGKIPYMLRERNKALTEDEFKELEGPLTAAANDAGIVGAMVLLGDGYNKSAPAQAFHWYSLAADQGDRAGLTKVGLMLASGDGTPRNLEKAIPYFERASEMGDPQAQFALAECLLEGKGGVQKDEPHALELIQAAAKNGYLRAINRLGNYYRKGILVKKDVAEARRLFTQAADLGDPEAYGNLGVIYMNGEGGISRDEFKGLELFEKGAEKGNAFCMYSLAQALDTGSGTDANRKEAAKWYKKAALAGHPKAKEWCVANNVSLDAP